MCGSALHALSGLRGLTFVKPLLANARLVQPLPDLRPGTLRKGLGLRPQHREGVVHGRAGAELPDRADGPGQAGAGGRAERNDALAGERPGAVGLEERVDGHRHVPPPVRVTEEDDVVRADVGWRALQLRPRPLVLLALRDLGRRATRRRPGSTSSFSSSMDAKSRFAVGSSKITISLS